MCGTFLFHLSYQTCLNAVLAIYISLYLSKKDIASKYQLLSIINCCMVPMFHFFNAGNYRDRCFSIDYTCFMLQVFRLIKILMIGPYLIIILALFFLHFKCCHSYYNKTLSFRPCFPHNQWKCLYTRHSFTITENGHYVCFF